VAECIREQKEVQQMGVSFVNLKQQHSNISCETVLPNEEKLTCISDDNSSVELEDGEIDSDVADSSAEDSAVEETVVAMPQGDVEAQHLCDLCGLLAVSVLSSLE
jgi:hypothetical protein